jgi:hypothetical protein
MLSALVREVVSAWAAALLERAREEMEMEMEMVRASVSEPEPVSQAVASLAQRVAQFHSAGMLARRLRRRRMH